MYLAKKNNNLNLPIYLSLFKKLAKGEALESKEEINKVLVEIKHISEGETDIFSARNDYYYLVSFLLSHGSQFLEKLDEKSIDATTYQEIAKLLDEGNVPA